MTPTYTTIWAPFAAAMKTSIETIPSVDTAIEGNLMRNIRYTDKKGSIGFYAILDEETGTPETVTLKRVAQGSKVNMVVGICCLSDKPAGSWLSENHWNLMDWLKDVWENNTNFTSTCKGWVIKSKVQDQDGSTPFVYLNLQITF